MKKYKKRKKKKNKSKPSFAVGIVTAGVGLRGLRALRNI